MARNKKGGHRLTGGRGTAKLFLRHNLAPGAPGHLRRNEEQGEDLLVEGAFPERLKR